MKTKNSERSQLVNLWYHIGYRDILANMDNRIDWDHPSDRHIWQQSVYYLMFRQEHELEDFKQRL